MLGNYELGIEWLLRSLATFNEWVVTYWGLSVAYAHLGRMDEAREAVRKILELTPHATVAGLAAGPFRDHAAKVLVHRGMADGRPPRKLAATSPVS